MREKRIDNCSGGGGQWFAIIVSRYRNLNDNEAAVLLAFVCFSVRPSVCPFASSDAHNAHLKISSTLPEHAYLRNCFAKCGGPSTSIIRIPRFSQLNRQVCVMW